MVNIDKVVNDIKNDGKYDAILDVVKDSLENDNPTLAEIRKLVENDSFYIAEYKDLNRWGELTSVHVRDLEIKQGETDEGIGLKKQINSNRKYLINGEEYEIKQKNIIYLAWTSFIALPSIYVIDNLVRITGLYKGNENGVYISFIIVILASVWGFSKVKNNHKRQHKLYIQTQIDTRALIKDGLDREYFTYGEVYQA